MQRQEPYAGSTGNRASRAPRDYPEGVNQAPYPPKVALEFLHGGFDVISTPTHKLTKVVHSDAFWMRANDPSAGSPTETLLRLLLPLSDKVH